MEKREPFNNGANILGGLRPSDITCPAEVFNIADEIVRGIRESEVDIDLNTVPNYVRSRIEDSQLSDEVTVERISNAVRGILEAAELLQCDPDLNTVIDKAMQIDDFRNPLPNMASCVRKIVGQKPDFTRRLRDLSDKLIFEAQSLDEVFGYCLDTALEVSGMDSGGVYVVNEDGSLKLMTHKGFKTDEFVKGVSEYPSDSPNAGLIRTGKPVYMDYPGLLENLRIQHHYQVEDLHAIGVIPIVHEGRVLACMNIASHSEEEISHSVKDALEMVAGYIAIYIDRELTQKSLRESEHKLRSIIEGSKDAVIVLGEGGKIEIFNPAAMEMFGVTDLSRIMGQSVSILMPGEYREKHEIDVMSYLSGGESKGAIGRTLTLPAVRQDGTLITVELSLSVVEGERRMVIADIRDVTERVNAQQERERLQVQLAQAQKMEAVGRLAGGIAHDFNNMLTAVSGLASITTLDAKKGDKEKVVENMADVMRVVSKSTDLTKQLLAFSREAVLKPVVVNLNKVIEEEVLPICRRIVREDIAFEAKLIPDLRYIKVDPSQIQQILLNLVVNSMDAISGSGTITVLTRNVNLDEENKARFGLATNQCVELSVQDDGHGIPKDVIDNIFEPFFTTKEVGRGTGLGLATVHGIVKQSGGHVTVASEEGKGTVFSIYFPVYMRSSTSDQRAVKTVDRFEDQEILRGNETILLVEDERAIRRPYLIMGERLGYQVIPATNGQEALQVIEGKAEDVDLVVTDIIMPRIGGPELIEKIRELNPNVKAILISGYPRDALEGIPDLDDVEFMHKPFSPSDLFMEIRKIMDRE